MSDGGRANRSNPERGPSSFLKAWPNPLPLPLPALLLVVRDRTHTVGRGPELRLLLPSTVWPLDGAMAQETRTRGWGGVVLLPGHQPSRYLHLRQTGSPPSPCGSHFQGSVPAAPCGPWAQSPMSRPTTGSPLFTGWGLMGVSTCVPGKVLVTIVDTWPSSL